MGRGGRARVGVGFEPADVIGRRPALQGKGRGGITDAPLPRAKEGWTGSQEPEPRDVSGRTMLSHHVDTAGNRSLSGAANAARGQRGPLSRARPATALILMGDWCASSRRDAESPTTRSRNPRSPHGLALCKGLRRAAPEGRRLGERVPVDRGRLMGDPILLRRRPREVHPRRVDPVHRHALARRREDVPRQARRHRVSPVRYPPDRVAPQRGGGSRKWVAVPSFL